MFEFLFSYPLAAYRKGDFLYATGWPVWLLILLIVAAVAGLVWHVRSKPGRLDRGKQVTLIALQSAMAALALFILWQPAIALRALRNQQNVVSILLDTSRSMAIGEGEQSRLQQAVAALNDGVLEALGEKFRVRIYGFTGTADRLESLEEIPPPGQSTRLGESVAGVLRESAATPLGALVVVSDGSDNSGLFSRELMAEIRQRKVPIHTVGVGRTEIVGDTELSNVLVASRALPKS